MNSSAFLNQALTPDSIEDTPHKHQLAVKNSLTDQKQLFVPIDHEDIRMYVCGITVYNDCHIGHARVFVVFDMINRYLRQIYGHDNVTYVRNITDIDDKIIAESIKQDKHFTDITMHYINSMHEDESSLGSLPPDIEPRATQHIDHIIDMIEQLLSNDMAYTTDDNHVYFDVNNFNSYGKLSNKNLDELIAGSRIDVSQSKRAPMDFVLWKPAKSGEPSWASPWGDGRPGWHIECSAMSRHCLGDKFDIHGGGMDLKFPHHENEIAQSEGCSGHSHVNYWLHNGFVRVNNEKMSKSLGNFFIIKDVLQHYHPEVIRFFILNSHYQSPLNYSDDNLNASRKALTGLYKTVSLFDRIDYHELDTHNPYVKQFLTAMDDNFNTPRAIAVLFELANLVNTHHESQRSIAHIHCSTLASLARLLGLLNDTAENFLHYTTAATSISNSEIESLINARDLARKDRDWERCDAIRDELLSHNIFLEDSKSGTQWRRA